MFSCMSTRTANCTHEIVLLRKKNILETYYQVMFPLFSVYVTVFANMFSCCPKMAQWLTVINLWLKYLYFVTWYICKKLFLSIKRLKKKNVNILAQFVIANFGRGQFTKLCSRPWKNENFSFFKKRVHNGGLCTRFIIVKTKFHILF